MGLNAALGIGVRGMMAAQMGMDITSQNISNVNTEGYSRKMLTLTSDTRYDELYGQMGFGAEVSNIRRMRDEFVDTQIQAQTYAKGYYSEVDNALERIENIFTEPQETGLSTYMEQFWNSWADLSSNPTDFGSRSAMQANAQVLIDAMHNVQTELRALQSSRNDLIQQKTGELNELLKEVYNLNNEIRQVEIGKNQANDSRDQRDQLLKEISKLVQIDSFEDETGAVTITSSGYMLVSPVNFSQLEIFTTSFQNADGTTRLDYGMRMANSKKEFVPQNGELKGVFTARDETVVYYMDKMDEFAAGLVTHVNELHASGYDLNGFTGANFFDPSRITAADISLSAAVRQDVRNIAAAIGGTDVADTTVISAGDIGSAATYDYGVAIPLDGVTSAVQNDDIVQGTVTVTHNGNVLTEGAGNDYVIDYINGTITFLSTSAANIQDPNTNDITIEYRYNVSGSKGPGDGSNALAISQLRYQVTMNQNYMGEYTSTYNDFYEGMMGTLGIERNETIANVESRDYLIRYLEKQQDAVAGVSLDEEMANLVKFEHAFSASARVITVVDEMIETILQM